jgi:formylglycine-generating enzyme
MAARTSSPASAFSKVLRSFETGGFTYRDVVAELKRLLKAGASPTELSDILRRRQFVEPLPVEAHKEVLGLLDAAKERAAAEAIDQRAESDGASSVPPTIVPTATRAEGVPNSTIRIVPPPRIPVPIPLPESKLITTPVQMPAARATHAPLPAWGSPSAVPSPRRSPDADGPGNVVARAITLARISASPARTSASPDSVQRKTGRIAPAKAGVAALAPRTAKIPTLIPPAENPVTDGEPAQAVSHELDDWSDLAIVREDLTADPIAARDAHKRRGVASRGSMARVIGWSAVALIFAAIAWFYPRHVPLPTKAALPAAAAPIPGTLIRDCPTCAAMMVLPAARFNQGFAATDRGSVSYEKPPHWVTISRPFAMSADLVTVEGYRQFIDATGRAVQGCETYDGAWKYRPENNWRNPGFAQSGLHPVTCVSWNDAVAYAQWLSTKTGHQYRLPSASEWEYAARAGSDTVYPWASNGSNACTYANVADASAARQYPGWGAFACDDGYANTSPVGSFKANALGLNDMLGNVFQWTLDCWQADYRGAPVDGSARTDGDCSERELRGGSWFTSPAYVRANYRNHFASDYRTSSVGIRLVRDIGP